MSANAETQTPQQPVRERQTCCPSFTLFYNYCRSDRDLLVLVLRHFEETDDAYVAGNQIQIMSQVSGVTKVWADNTDFVKEGDVLVTSTRQMLAAFEKPKLHWLPAFAKPTS